MNIRSNSGNGDFQYASYTSGLAGITLLHSGWGVRFLDYDNDGWKDLLIAQGHVMDTIHLDFPDLHYLKPPVLLRNGRGKFANVSKASGAVFSERWAGRGLAIGDINNDGKMDAVITTNDGPAYLLRNETPSPNHWLTLKLVGRKTNRDGIGAAVTVKTSALTQYRTVTTGGSYCSSSDVRPHFGLGDATKANVEIQWPSGIVQCLANLAADRIVSVKEPDK
ncbi:MAG: CRTAC1 family protein [Terriglobia bacterium]